MPSDTTAGRLGYEQYVGFPDDGRRHEIVDGEHFVNPAPSTDHQSVSMRIAHQLFSQIELRGLGTVLSAPVDVQLSDHDIVQPDLVVILNAHRSIIARSKINGAPDLVVEITSPSSDRLDRTVKKDRYQEFGVLEYWIVDPAAKTIEQFVLREGKYQLQQPNSSEVHSSIVGGMILRRCDVW
jgi:Uma2 family endonuclease